MPDGTYLTERIVVAKRPFDALAESPGQAIQNAVRDLAALATFLGLLDREFLSNCDDPEMLFWRESLDAKVTQAQDGASQLQQWFAPVFEEDDEDPGDHEAEDPNPATALLKLRRARRRAQLQSRMNELVTDYVKEYDKEA